MTAEVFLSLQQLADNASRLSEVMQQRGLCWVPVVTSAIPRDVRAVLQESARGPVACQNSATAIELRDAGCKSIWIRQPVVDADQLAVLANGAAETQIHFTIDHFVHAEWISEACGSDRNAKCVLQLQSRQDAAGVRPGRDALMLAEAIDGLSGIECEGVYADSWLANAVDSSADENGFAADLLLAMTATVQLFLRHGRKCSTVAITDGLMQNFENGTRGFSWWAGNDAAFGFGPLATAVASKAVATVRCRVVSRPHLSIAIVNAGAAEIGVHQYWPRVDRLAGAHVTAVRDHALTLELTGAARDLTIGDWVDLSVPATPNVLQHAQVNHR